jgi:hypothetical protein
VIGIALYIIYELRLRLRRLRLWLRIECGRVHRNRLRCHRSRWRLGNLTRRDSAGVELRTRCGRRNDIIAADFSTRQTSNGSPNGYTNQQRSG